MNDLQEKENKFREKTNSIFITTKQKPKFIIHFYKKNQLKNHRNISRIANIAMKKEELTRAFL